jgi:hypothetical protein
MKGSLMTTPTRTRALDRIEQEAEQAYAAGRRQDAEALEHFAESAVYDRPPSRATRQRARQQADFRARQNKSR